MATLTVATPVPITNERISAFPPDLGIQTADGLIQEIADLEKTLKKHSGFLFGIGRTMPAQQIRAYWVRLDFLRTVKMALELGFEPYTPPRNWYAGFLDEKGRRRSPMRTSEFNYFKALIPPAALARYQTALKAKVFDNFVVASPNKEHFQRIVQPVTDPVLVGYIGTQGKPPAIATSQSAYYHLQVKDGVGFLIAMWGIADDLKFAPQEKAPLNHW